MICVVRLKLNIFTSFLEFTKEDPVVYGICVMFVTIEKNNMVSRKGGNLYRD